MIPPELTSARLQFKPLDTSFASQAYVDWMNDEQVNRYLESGGDYDKDKLIEYLTQVELRGILFWAIVTKDERHIGNIKIDPVNYRNRTAEFGILIGDRSEWGKGFGKEASERIINYCFSQPLNLRKVTLGVVRENKSAFRLYKNMGFEIEGLYKDHAYHHGRWCDVIRMSIFNTNLQDAGK